MDHLDGIPLIRCGMQFGSVTNSSDFVFSQLRDELVDYSSPWWYILVMWIISLVGLVLCVGVIVLADHLHIQTSLREGAAEARDYPPFRKRKKLRKGAAVVTRGAKCSRRTSTVSCTIFRYILDVWITSLKSLVLSASLLVIFVIMYHASLVAEGHVIASRAKLFMSTSDGGRSSYGLAGHSSPWYILDMNKHLLITSFLLLVWNAGLHACFDLLPLIDAIVAEKFSMKNKGIEIMLGSCKIRVPKSSSAHKSILQMVRFARHLCGVASYMVPKYILQSRPSTSRHACKAGLVSARHKLESCNAAISKAVLMESSGRIKPEHRSVPMDACDDTAEQHCDTMKVEAMVAASPLVASAARNSATWNRSLLSGFTPRYGMKIIAIMIIKMYVASMKLKMLAVENKYLSRTITSSEHKDEHLGAARALSGLQTEEENTLVVTKTIPDTNLEHPSGPETIKAEERKAAATWLIATAASHHATGDRSLLSGFTPEDGLFVEAGDGSPMHVLGRGSVVTNAVVLPDVWFIPGLTANLVSVSKLTELDYSVGFTRAACFIRGATDGAVVGKAHAGEDGMFELDFLRVPPPF